MEDTSGGKGEVAERGEEQAPSSASPLRGEEPTSTLSMAGMAAESSGEGMKRELRFFLFYIFLKLKFQKYISVLKYFKNTPDRPHRATGLKCNFFFFKFAMRSLGKKSHVAPQRATGACRPAHGRPAAGPSPRAAGGPVAPPTPRATGGPVGRPGYPPYKSSIPSLPFSFEPENSTKNPEKKRGVRRREAAKPCRIPHL